MSLIALWKIAICLPKVSIINQLIIKNHLDREMTRFYLRKKHHNQEMLHFVVNRTHLKKRALQVRFYVLRHFEKTNL